jgi:RNA ligase
LLDQLKGKPYYITQKMDGTSATFYNWKGVFGVCSRNLEMKNPYENPKERFKYIWDSIKRFFRVVTQRSKQNPRKFNLNIYWKMVEKYKINEWLPDGYAIQAEICGPSIQGNKMGLKDNEMFVFNLWHIELQKYCNPFEWGAREYIKLVPLIKEDVSFPETTIDALLNLADGVYQNETPQEGVVIRSIDQSISFKVVNNKFLLRYSE